MGRCGARQNRAASPSSTFRPNTTKAQDAKGATHAGPYSVPCLPPLHPRQPPELTGTSRYLSSILIWQVWHRKVLVLRGGEARRQRFPEPPVAFNLPAPPLTAVAKVTGSWGKVADPRPAPPEAQGAREARPQAASFCRFRRSCGPTSAAAGRLKKASSAGLDWPSPAPGHPMNPSAINPRATGSGWLWAAPARRPPRPVPPRPMQCGRKPSEVAWGLC